MKWLDFIVLYLALFLSVAVVCFLLKHGVIDVSSPVNMVLIMALMSTGPIFACLYGVLHLHGRIHMTGVGVKTVRFLTFFAALTAASFGGAVYMLYKVGKEALIIFPYIGAPIFIIFTLVSWVGMFLMLYDSRQASKKSKIGKMVGFFVQFLVVIPILVSLYFLSLAN